MERGLGGVNSQEIRRTGGERKILAPASPRAGRDEHLLAAILSALQQ